MGHVLMKNRNSLAIYNRISKSGYHAESDAALEMAQGFADGGKRQFVLTDITIKTHRQRGCGKSILHPMRHKIYIHGAITSVDGRTTRHQSYGSKLVKAEKE